MPKLTGPLPLLPALFPGARMISSLGTGLGAVRVNLGRRSPHHIPSWTVLVTGLNVENTAFPGSLQVRVLHSIRP